MPIGVYKHIGTNKGKHWKIKDTSKMKGRRHTKEWK